MLLCADMAADTSPSRCRLRYGSRSQQIDQAHRRDADEVKPRGGCGNGSTAAAPSSVCVYELTVATGRALPHHNAPSRHLQNFTELSGARGLRGTPYWTELYIISKLNHCGGPRLSPAMGGYRGPFFFHRGERYGQCTGSEPANASSCGTLRERDKKERKNGDASALSRSGARGSSEPQPEQHSRRSSHQRQSAGPRPAPHPGCGAIPGEPLSDPQADPHPHGVLPAAAADVLLGSNGHPCALMPS